MSNWRAPGRVIWDNHVCAPLRPLDFSFLPMLERYRAAGFTTVSLNVGFGDQSAEDHLRMLASFRAWLAERPEHYALVSTADDVRRAAAEGRLGILFDVEGMAFLNGQLALIPLLYDLGVRWMSIAYNRNNDVGGGCQDEDGGLTAFGREVLAEAKRVGMVVCCSHTGHRTAREVMEATENPIIFSHSNASAVHPHFRNIGDDLIVKCARTGGVVGVNGIGMFLGANDNSTEALVRHIDHMVQLVGPAHVAIALDMCSMRRSLMSTFARSRISSPRAPAMARASPWLSQSVCRKSPRRCCGWVTRMRTWKRCSAALC